MDKHICIIGKHRRRDNSFGITWCTECGRLFTKPSNIKLDKNFLNKEESK